MKPLFKILDFLIIAFKCFLLVYLYTEYLKISNDEAKRIDLNFMIPYICYASLNLFRLFVRKNLTILFIEASLNIIFIWKINYTHFIYLLLTLLSFLIIYLSGESRLRIKNGHT